MQLKTILNRVQKFKSFVYENVVWLDSEENLALLVQIAARANSKPICSGCGCPGPGYDTLEPRMFEFVPLWNIAIFFDYALRRVDCETCGVKIKKVPWADGKNTLTKTYMQFLATWAKKLSWKEVAVTFRTTWEKVFRSVEWAVQWGLAHRDLSNVQSIGVDEVLWQRGHKYLTVVYQIDTECKRLLWVGKDRTIKTLLRFFRTFGKERSALLVAGQALMGMFFVGELTKFVFRQPMNGLDAVLPVSLFVAAVAILASLALSYWRLYRQSHPQCGAFATQLK